jgi:hypothetical protein
LFTASAAIVLPWLFGRCSKKGDGNEQKMWTLIENEADLKQNLAATKITKFGLFFLLLERSCVKCFHFEILDATSEII